MLRVLSVGRSVCLSLWECKYVCVCARECVGYSIWSVSALFNHLFIVYVLVYASNLRYKIYNKYVYKWVYNFLPLPFACLYFLSVCAICCCFCLLCYSIILKYRTGNYIACCLSKSKICVIGQLHLLYKCKFIVRIISEKESKKLKTKLQSETKNHWVLVPQSRSIGSVKVYFLLLYC